MNQFKNRKYARTFKKNDAVEETVLNLSTAAAVGILALAFVKGMFWGYIIRKSIK